jgi:hypothetical protein
MSKHTPGPWRYWICRVDNRLDPPMYDYAQFANPKEHVFRAPMLYLREADARLIAAAPELLEALKLAVRQNEHDMLMTGEELRNARAAIAKAEGV